ncbi:MAG: hypothetical protein GX862_10270, partial [Leucobacter sp.]|nr:hypothetical protein [Leucobacter sp.]
PYAEAEQLLTAAGFSVINGGDVDSSVTAGLVASSNPAGEAGRGAGITLYISLGNLRVIPDGLVGDTGAGAESRLLGAGFSNVSFTCGPTTNPPGSPNPPPPPSPDKNTMDVVSSNPATGSEANPAHQVTLSLNCGP